MRKKAIALFSALVLCMSAFVLPTTALAAESEDSTPPALSAELQGETLRLKATDEGSGLQAIYIDGSRVNTLVNGGADVKLKSYAGSGKQVSVYAVDYAGNRSETIMFDNPYYKAPAVTSPPSQTQQKPSSPPSSPAPLPGTGENGNKTEQPDGQAQQETETETAIPEGAFTPDGSGSILDSATGTEGEKQFYTITTEAGNVFYLVIDGKRDANNVYFLNAVTESDLMALAQKGDGTVSVVPVKCTCGEKCTAGQVDGDCPVCKNDLTGCTGKEKQADPAEPKPEEQPEKESGGNMGLIVFIVIGALAVGAAGYYFKILRPKRQAADEDDEDESSYGESFDAGTEYDSAYLPEDDGEFLEDEE